VIPISHACAIAAETRRHDARREGRRFEHGVLAKFFDEQLPGLPRHVSLSIQLLVALDSRRAAGSGCQTGNELSGGDQIQDGIDRVCVNDLGYFKQHVQGCQRFFFESAAQPLSVASLWQSTGVCLDIGPATASILGDVSPRAIHRRAMALQERTVGIVENHAQPACQPFS
jgi:hypothetical protein